jgi:uncharacterized membrane protein YuzA (DUF378 family)
MVTFTLLAIGGLNWLGTAFGYNVVQMIFKSGADGKLNAVAMIIYVLVGLSAIYELATHKSNCMCCSGKCDTMNKMGSTDSMKSM